MINNYRASIKDGPRGRGRILIIERMKDGKPERKLTEAQLVDGFHGRGTWAEVKTRLAEYNLKAVDWEPVNGGLQASCVTM